MVDQTSQFYAILTNIGLAKQANADALGVPWTFAQMGVGDGNPSGLDNPPLPMPAATQTALLNEWRRAPLNQLKVDPNNAAVIIAEQVIPADVGGKWIREISLYDADGDLVAVANCPPTFKPLLSQGSGRTQVVRLNLVVRNTSNVQLKIDPSVVLATREWVESELAKQDFKHSVLAATTAPITLSGLQTVDGVALTAGARVLVKNQAAAKDNGLYQVVAGGAWTRCSDADISAEVSPGLLVLVERGTLNADSAWQLTTDGPITLGVTALTFEMAFGRTGVAAGTYRSVQVDAYGRVVAATNPTTVAGYGLTDVYTKTQIDQALALKAALESPTFSGAVKVPTLPVATNNEQAASTAFVKLVVSALVGSSPATLDTLNELAAALGNDPNFAATMAEELGKKANKATTLGGYGILDSIPCFASAPSDIAAILSSAVNYQNPSGGHQNGLGTAAGCVLTISQPGAAGFQLYGRDDNLLYRGHTANAYGAVRTIYHSGNFNPAGKADKSTTLAGYGIVDALQVKPNFVSRQLPTLAAPSAGLTAADAAMVLREAQEVGAAQSGDEYAPAIGFYWLNKKVGRLIMDSLGALKWQGNPLLTGTIATQAETEQGLSDTAVVTPKRLRLGFAASWTSNGYLILPSWLGGFVFQWGTVPASPTGGSQKNFVIPFPTKFLCMVGSPWGNLSSSFESAEFWGATESTFFSANLAGQTNSYFAIGY
uniref:phage tail protein n=1 Tax=Pseudomonas taiwanensis TaxID=470150 RepID=UPI0036F2BE39